jgi:hypothetical protein
VDVHRQQPRDFKECQRDGWQLQRFANTGAMGSGKGGPPLRML